MPVGRLRCDVMRLRARLLGRSVGDFDAKPIGIEDEHLVVAIEVAVLLRREVNPRADLQAALMGGVDLVATVDVEGQVLEPHLVIAMLAAVGRPQTEVLIAAGEAEVDDLLGAAITGEALPRVQAETETYLAEVCD